MNSDLPQTIYVHLDKIGDDDDDDVSLEMDEDEHSCHDVEMSDYCNKDRNRNSRLQAVHVLKSSSCTFRTSTPASPHLQGFTSSFRQRPNMVSPEPTAVHSASSLSQAGVDITPDQSVCTRETSAGSDFHDQLLKQQYLYRLERLARSMRYTDMSRVAIQDLKRGLDTSTSSRQGLLSESYIGYRSEMYEWIKQQRQNPMNMR